MNHEGTLDYIHSTVNQNLNDVEDKLKKLKEAEKKFRKNNIAPASGKPEGTG
ncbi:hypothetical protein [Bacillus glycinifermentans]|uniref:Uncharacterized protein n=1 Tax=Bacillus glycinifermentans TaxID=1664069 RepID=A0ABU6H1R3_9BACI|nr:hypothetical protein [Bacillus glycinifermentans]MEC0484967.1 hypothetical protein [Bacillus glycinifermentans]MEC0496077.1 hypothetical protein [Bacillus glycinifermentans]MEC0539196.1 hypothetical protein [Bacillus glycinifermentans]MEC3605980.1 hypothetical protein [Bacillus glycinifermentans]UOY89850.1 hypothetical protein MW696_06405 [Bacillus glycinifermentans]